MTDSKRDDAKTSARRSARPGRELEPTQDPQGDHPALAEQDYRGLVEQMADAAHVISADLRFLAVNERACELLGYSRQEFFSMGPLDIDRGMSHEAAQEIIAQVVEGSRRLIESQHEAKDGRIIPVEIALTPVTYLGQAAVLGVVRDVTLRKQAEEALQALTRRNQAILQTIPDIIAEVDENRIYTWVNEAGLQFFGEDVIGRETSYYFVDNQETYVSAQPLSKGDPDTRYVESWQRRADGENRLLAWWCRSLRDENGEVTGVLSTARDVTERWRANAMRDARLRLLELAPTTTLQEFLHAALRELELLTRSPVGFCNLFNDDQNTFSAAACAALAGGSSLEPPALHQTIPQAGVWADCYRQRRAVIYNDYQSLSHRKGTPPGHVELTRILTVPVFREDKVVAVLAVGNKATDYTERDVETAASFADLTWDTAARKQAEAALQDSDEFNRRLFDSSPDAVFLSEPGGHFLDCNRTAVERYGYSREEFLQMTYMDLAALDLRDSAGAHVRDTLAKGGTVFERRHMRKDGSELPVEIRTAPFMAHGQKRIMATVRDLTQSKAAEEALRRSEREFRALFEAAPMGIGVADLQGNILAFNQALLEPGGYSAEDIEATGNAAALYYEPAETEVAKALFLAQGHLRQHETRFRRKDGSPYDVWLSLSHTTFNGVPCMQAIVVDRTEQRQAEEERERLETQLRQAAKMESVGRLAGGVAHDFNNMLAVILGHTELALAQVSLEDRLFQDLTEVRRAAERSAGITQQLLAFARRQVIAPKVVDINQSVKGMLEMLNTLIGEQIELLWRPGRGLGHVQIDPAQLDQVLINLCLNARDAINGSGRVIVQTANATLDEKYCAQHEGCLPGRYVQLSVSDDGAGMTAEALEHLFEPFFTTKDAGRGTGLGLATVYGIVTQNRGHIQVQTDAERGTRVYIYLPRVDADVTREAPDTLPMGPPRGAETLLVVEDEPSVLRLTTRILSGLGYTVLAAPGPYEALRLVREHPSDIALVITDVVMPEMNGWQLSEQLRGVRPGLLTLYVSGYTDETIHGGSLHREGLEFLQKPFTLQELAIRVRQMLDTR